MHVDAGVAEVFFRHPEFAQMGQPLAVDLRQPDVLAAVGIHMHRAGVEAGLLCRNRIQHLRVHAIAFGRPFPGAERGRSGMADDAQQCQHPQDVQLKSRHPVLLRPVWGGAKRPTPLRTGAAWPLLLADLTFCKA